MPKSTADPALTREAVLAVRPWLTGEDSTRPPRAALAEAVRRTARTLEKLAPGQAVELRVPPFVAVQCIAGPQHTRGNPPNVVEMDVLIWLRLATGIVAFEEAEMSASGTRCAEIKQWLPLVPLA